MRIEAKQNEINPIKGKSCLVACDNQNKFHVHLKSKEEQISKHMREQSKTCKTTNLLKSSGPENVK